MHMHFIVGEFPKSDRCVSRKFWPIMPPRLPDMALPRHWKLLDIIKNHSINNHIWWGERHCLLKEIYSGGHSSKRAIVPLSKRSAIAPKENILPKMPLMQIARNSLAINLLQNFLYFEISCFRNFTFPKRSGARVQSILNIHIRVRARGSRGDRTLAILL